ncbi:2TM domain-containing protein [Nocardioides sp. YIM 152588]|uniref:2TM domain-containing protein n=1 Tax=Nocardioides sp. YIM 152588 TaxID=3158259 RepID=UPI0032E3DB37
MSRRDDDMAAAEKRARALTDLQWHVGAYVILNVFFWILDLAVGQSGLQWAFWVTLFWGLGLAFHVLSYMVEGRQVERRAARRYERDERDEREERDERHERHGRHEREGHYERYERDGSEERSER